MSSFEDFFNRNRFIHSYNDIIVHYYLNSQRICIYLIAWSSLLLLPSSRCQSRQILFIVGDVVLSKRGEKRDKHFYKSRPGMVFELLTLWKNYSISYMISRGKHA